MATTNTTEKPVASEKKEQNRNAYKTEEKKYKLIPKGYNPAVIEHKGVYMTLKAYDLASEVNGVVKDLMETLTKLGDAADKATDAMLNPSASGMIKGALDVSEGTAKLSMNTVGTIYNVATSGNAGQIIMDAVNKGVEFVKSKTIEAASVAENGIKRAITPHAVWTLPLPNQISSNMSHNYTEDEMDPIDKLQSLKGFQALKIASGASQKMVDIAISTMREGVKMAKRSNATIDTNVLTIFTGTNCRQFTLDFTLIALNEQHANEIVSAILALKVNMSGYRDSAQLVIVQDNIFSIGFIDDDANSVRYIEELLMLDHNVDLNLTDINITYGADGAMTLFRNGLPKVITMSLSFVERKPIYFNDSKKKGSGEPVKQ